MNRISRCRELRRLAPDAEKCLWNRLRRNRLGVGFRRQHGFGRYILDFFCPEKQLAIEADGGQHFTPEGLAYDAARTEYLRGFGVKVLRFTDREILQETDRVVATIWKEIGGRADLEDFLPARRSGRRGRGCRGAPP